MLKLKINVNLPQLLCIVISAAENGEFERFGGFSVDCYYTSLEGLLLRTCSNIVISRCKFTLLRLFNISHTFLYISNIQTDTLFVWGPCGQFSVKFCPRKLIKRGRFFLVTQKFIMTFKDNSKSSNKNTLFFNYFLYQCCSSLKFYSYNFT